MTTVPASAARTLAAGVIGNMLEWYDFAVYGYFAAQIGRTFFPGKDEVTQILSAFGIFAVGYVMRPLGGCVMGHIGDKFGRKVALTVSVTAMAIPTFLVGVLPGYQTLGVAAPIILTLLRMVQGVSVGGECTTSWVFLFESSPPGRRGLAGGFAEVGNCGGILLGSLTGSLIANALSTEAIEQWAWRVPFILGLLVGVIGYFLRRHLPVAPMERKATRAPLVETLRDHRPLLLWLAGLTVYGSVGFYLIFLYVVSWLQFADGVSPAHALEINTLSMVALIPTVLAAGWLSDRFGRKPLLLLALFIGLFGAFPLFRLMHHSDPTMILAGQLGFALSVGMFWGTLPTAMVEAAPPHVRCSALSLGFNVTAGIVGGLTPLVATWLVHRTADDFSPAYMMMGAAAISLLAMVFYREPYPSEVPATAD
jgi:MHS family proline/betaine transporter-like MFS transporter